ncbi:calcium:proton antiporter [Halomonas halocynthiae]|uniref:calcium:proton antiporter n=1 Tax=Halomonas halocynthiae TaxID=176290 RepID=UPI0004108510|nr:ionic transporter y4hA [Halomonas halocynthiae]
MTTPKSNENSRINRVIHWAWLAPLAAWLLIGAEVSGLIDTSSTIVLLISAILLGGAIFSAVHHAEIIAAKVGEPFGSIILAMSVTIIEVALIISVMLSPDGGHDTLARDAVFATIMIVLNGIVGLSLIVGGMRHLEQSFQNQGTAAALSVLGTLAVIALILPNYTLAVAGPFYAPIQLVLIGVFSIVLYGIFLFVQTIRHRSYFLLDESSALGTDNSDTSSHHAIPSKRTTLVSLALLIMTLFSVVILAELLAPTLTQAVLAADLPISLVGVVIAALVLMPEGIASVRAAKHNRLQTSLTLALGSAMATIGLTIPLVAFAAVLLDQPLALGLRSEEMVLLLLSLFIGTITLATGRTTILQGAVHLVIFAIFMLLAVMP